jgi:hypothetical protein
MMSASTCLHFVVGLTFLRPPIRRKYLEGPTYTPSQVLRWVRVPFEDQQGFAKLAGGYRIEWDGLVQQGAKQVEGKIALCKWNARVCRLKV